MTGTLFVLGIALFAAAFIGGGRKVSNVIEIPVISTRVGGFGLALVGLNAIALGYQLQHWDTRSEMIGIGELYTVSEARMIQWISRKAR